MSYGGFWRLCCTGLLARLLDFLEPRRIKQSMQPECCIQREKPLTPETVNPGWTEQTPAEVRHSSLQVRTHARKQRLPWRATEGRTVQKWKRSPQCVAVLLPCGRQQELKSEKTKCMRTPACTHILHSNIAHIYAGNLVLNLIRDLFPKVRSYGGFARPCAHHKQIHAAVVFFPSLL